MLILAKMWQHVNCDPGMEEDKVAKIMQTCGLAPDCAVCCIPGDCPYEYILTEAPLEEYLAWRDGDDAYQKYLEEKELKEYGVIPEYDD